MLEKRFVQGLDLKEPYLLKNFVKNELLPNLFLRILRLFMDAPTCHDIGFILSLCVLALSKCIFRFSFP